MEYSECNMNITYDLPKEIWEKVRLVYEKMTGWIGFAEDGLPYWYSTNEDEKSIFA